MEKERDSVTFLIPFFVISIFFLDFFFPLPLAFWVFYFLPVIVPLWMGRPDRRYLCTITALCSFLIVVAPLINPGNEDMLVVILDRLFAVSFVWLLAFFMNTFLSERDQGRAVFLEKEVFKTLVESSVEASFFFDLDMRYIYASPKIGQYAGIDSADCRGKTNEEAGINRDLAAAWRSAFHKAISSRRPQTFEFPAPSPARRGLHFTLIPQLSSDGIPEAVIGYVCDSAPVKITP